MGNVNNNFRCAKGNARRYTKSCEFYEKQCRPAISNQALKNQLEKDCGLCKRPLFHNNTCTASREHIFDGDTCTLTHFGTRDHNVFQLNDDQQKKLADYLVNSPQITSKAAVVGNNPLTGQIIGLVSGIDQVLGKTADDLFEGFDRNQRNYPGYVYSKSVTLDVFVITFRAPEMSRFVDMKLFLVIMNVTFKAVKNSGEHKRYLCLSALYFSSIRRNSLVFQAIIGGLTEMYFHQYFLAFFTAYKISFTSEDNFFGMIMDFSAAQRNRFLSAYKMYTYKREDGMKYLEGCYMHWMKYIQLISSNGKVVPQEERSDFLRLVHTIRTTEDGNVFNSA
ncbi:hypothetical protein INT45_006313 [Circinella minor]|uniref:Uncharacterized protein n=1 Tax=Circinella minor TaxID=1195481 RepID=A0A8H7RWJ1_9FUNG|nr:hypothetical protein INT45_006313 [Circinella minor]